MTLVEAINELLQIGFTPAGATPETIVRVPTQRSPLFGGTGGELRSTGGRARYVLPGTDLRVTVGPRTTNVYFSRGGQTEFILNERTKDLTPSALRAAVGAATGRTV